jgi:DNA-binding NarL/FixJ family response regulator
MPGDGVPAIDLQDVASLPTVALGIPALLMVESLARALRDCDLHVVGCHVRLAALLEKVRRCRPDIVIVDAGMAALPVGAPNYLAQLAGAGAGSRFVVLADDVDRALARAVIDHGVQAVILKSTPVADAVGVLRHVAHGRTSFPAAVLDRIGDRPDEHGLSARASSRCSRSSRSGARTGRSRAGCSSPRTPSSSTCARSTSGSASATASRRRGWPATCSKA